MIPRQFTNAQGLEASLPNNIDRGLAHSGVCFVDVVEKHLCSSVKAALRFAISAVEHKLKGALTPVHLC